MSLVKLTIPGEFLDSQIYRGRLYLFERAGSILTLGWDRLVDGLTQDPALKLAVACAFRRSDYLYRVASTGIFHDPEFKTLLFARFERLSHLDLHITESALQRAVVSRQDNAFPSPHSDSIIYSQQLLVSGRTGLFRAGCSGRTKLGVSTRVEKLWDGPSLSINASYYTLAMALGEDGLWQCRLSEGYSARSTRPERLADRHCTDCNWAFYSLFASSNRSHGFLAAYRKDKQADEPFGERQFDRFIDDEELFSQSPRNGGGYSWAAQDKICRASNGAMSVLKYQPWLDQEQLTSLGALALGDAKGPVVAARVALFGTVVEVLDGLVVIPSEGALVELPGEPTAWRVFPRSHHYENHLHVIYEDRIEILSFNHDYFVEQRAKVSGISGFGAPRHDIFDSLSF